MIAFISYRPYPYLFFAEWYYFLQSSSKPTKLIIYAAHYCLHNMPSIQILLLQFLNIAFHYKASIKSFNCSYGLHEWSYIPFPEEFPPDALLCTAINNCSNTPGHGTYKRLLILHFPLTEILFLYKNSNNGNHILCRKYLKACLLLLLLYE